MFIKLDIYTDTSSQNYRIIMKKVDKILFSNRIAILKANSNMMEL